MIYYKNLVVVGWFKMSLDFELNFLFFYLFLKISIKIDEFINYREIVLLLNGNNLISLSKKIILFWFLFDGGNDVDYKD